MRPEDVVAAMSVNMVDVMFCMLKAANVCLSSYHSPKSMVGNTV